MQTTASHAANGHLTGYGSPSYRHYVLILLMLVYTLNFIDRTLIAVVAQPIIESFQLTDAQWGLLYGCLLYTSPSPRDAHESRMPSSA